MFGIGLTSYSSSFSQSMAMPFGVPFSQPYPSPFLRSQAVQPIFVPTLVGVPFPQPMPIPIERPCAMPVPHPVPFPVDRPYGVPFPVPVSVPQPVAVPQPVLVREHVPVPFPVSVPQPFQYNAQEEFYAPSSCRQVEYITEEPVRIVRCRRRRRRCRSYYHSPAPRAPIIIPISIPAPASQHAPPYQVTEYIQDIYPPAHVFTEQVPVGYTVQNSVIEQPGLVQSQSHPGIIRSPASYVSPSTGAQPQIVQQLPTGQFVQRPLNVGGGGVQNMVLQQSNVSPSNSGTLFSTPSFGPQFNS